MKFDEMAVLLPCHSLDDFPTYLDEDDARSLLAAWTALWHPLLVAHTGKIPTWYRADITPDAPGATLFTLPSASESLIPIGWTDRIEEAGGRVIRPTLDRTAVIAEALAATTESIATESIATESADAESTTTESTTTGDAELAADFVALGYGYLQVDILTRQMRYMPSLDESQLATWLVEAAVAFKTGDLETARKQLGRCFEMLLEARERFYPVNAYLLDVTLLAPTTSGDALDRELASPAAVNVMFPAEVLDRLASSDPASLEKLKHAVGDGRVQLIGGELDDGPLPLEDAETSLRRIRSGIEVFERRLGKRPLVYGRRRAGLTPLLPQWLSRLGYIGALHFTLDDGHFPKLAQSKTRWEGVDGSTIDAFARLPIDGRLASSFLALSVKLAESMDFDHVAALAIAHWAGESSEYYDDLRRMARYEPVFGKFVGVDDFFSQTDTAGRLTQSKVDDYRVPYLAQQVRAGAAASISGSIDQLTAAATDMARSALETTCDLLTGEVSEQGVDTSLGELAARLAAAIPRRSADAGRGVMVLNPSLDRRRSLVRIEDWQGRPPVGDAVTAAEVDGDVCRAVVDVPAMGFVWLDEGNLTHDANDSDTKRSDTKRSDARKKVTPTKQLIVDASGDEHRLRNEFLDVVIDPHSGGIRSLRENGGRHNRLSQQLAMRSPAPPAEPGSVWRDPDETAEYTVMAADDIEVTLVGPAVGEIVSRGRLVDREGTRLAGFEQTVQLARGSRVLLIDVQLDCDTAPAADPWNAYYAARWAWHDETADLYRSVGLGRFASDARRIEAPQYVEVNESPRSATVLSGGLPYHRRCGMRMLDTLLVVAGEERRRFRLGVGLDLAHPARDALAMTMPACWSRDEAGPPAAGPVGWFFHVDAKNVVATHWEPINAVPAADEGSTPARSDIVGFRVRLLETDGRTGQVTLQAYRAISAAQQIDFRGEVLAECAVREGAAVVEMTSHEWVQLEVFWAD